MPKEILCHLYLFFQEPIARNLCFIVHHHRALVWRIKTGWMTCGNFLAALKDIAKYSFSTLDNPILLLIDNSETHIRVEIIKFCKENGIVILTFNPHCNHRKQLLDVSVFDPLKVDTMLLPITG